MVDHWDGPAGALIRVASLLPSATEHICALGGRAFLVGVSHECDHPADVVGLPILTRCRTSLGRDSLAIDRSIRNLLQRAAAVYEVDVDALAAVRPDVIVHPTRLDDVWSDLRRVAEALHLDVGRALDAIHRRVAAVAERTAGLRRPRVLTIEWLDPVMIGGTWMPELVELAGGEPLVTTPGQHAPTLTDDEIGMLDPDVVLVKPCGYDLPRTFAERARLGTLAGMFPRARVYAADGSAYFNRPGPRIADSLEILAAAVHPEVFGEDSRLVRC